METVAEADNQMQSGGKSSEEIAEWLANTLAEEIGVSPGEMDVRAPFTRYGLTSARAVILVGELEDWLGRDLPATLFWDYTSISKLSRHLAGEEGSN